MALRKKLVGILCKSAAKQRTHPAIACFAPGLAVASPPDPSSPPLAANSFSSISENNGAAELGFSTFLHCTSISSHSFPSRTFGSATDAHLSLLCPYSSLSGVRSARYQIPLSGTSIVSSTQSPLFLSSPSSLLSQSATPFYCSRDIDLPGIYQNVCVQDVLRDKTRLHPVCHVRETAAEFGSPTWNAVYLQQDVDTIGEKDESAAQDNSLSTQDVFNWPNAISFGRLLSGPLLAWLILEGQPQPALFGLLLAGASDWLDGYIARKNGVDSAIGTYLDPLADKVLIGCVTLSMAQAGYLHPALVALVLSRDAALVGGSFIYQAYCLNWKWNSLKDFFKVSEEAVQKVRPLFISKVNTVFQLALVGTALVQPAFGFEDTYSLVALLSWSVAFTTCASWVGYGLKFLPKKAFR